MPSSRAHKMAKGQYSTGGAVGRAMRTMRRHYADGGDVVKDRAMFLPLGTYGDGTTRAAWPGLLYEPAAAWKRMMDSGYRPGDAETTRQMAEDSFTVAGAAPIAGLAAGAVRGRMPRATLSSNAADDVAKRLPMDEASRMARAKEMGFDLPAYHATSAEFTEFKPGYRGASFFADNADAAERGATYGAMDKYGTAAPTDRVMPVMLRSKHIAGLNLTPKERTWWEGLPQRADENTIESLKMPSHNIDYWWRVYDEVQNPDGTFTYVKKPVPSTTIDEVRKTGRNVYGDKYFGSYDGEQYMAKSAFEDGMDGFILSDEAGIGIGIADPRRIRSVNAAFDPAQADSADILAANTTKASAPGLGALEANRVRSMSDPKIFWHGSDADFDIYDPGKFASGAWRRKWLGANSQTNPRMFLTNSRDHAALYGNPMAFEVDGRFAQEDALRYVDRWVNTINQNLSSEEAYKNAYDYVRKHGDDADALFTALNADEYLNNVYADAINKKYDGALVDFRDLSPKASGLQILVANPKAQIYRRRDLE